MNFKSIFINGKKTYLEQCNLKIFEKQIKLLGVFYRKLIYAYWLQSAFGKKLITI